MISVHIDIFVHQSERKQYFIRHRDFRYIDKRIHILYIHTHSLNGRIIISRQKDRHSNVFRPV